MATGTEREKEPRTRNHLKRDSWHIDQERGTWRTRTRWRVPKLRCRLIVSYSFIIEIHAHTSPVIVHVNCTHFIVLYYILYITTYTIHYPQSIDITFAPACFKAKCTLVYARVVCCVLCVHLRKSFTVLCARVLQLARPVIVPHLCNVIFP